MTDKEFLKFLDGIWEISPEDYQEEDADFNSDFDEWAESDDEYEVEDIDEED